MLHIRKATPGDAQSLQELYLYHLAKRPPEQDQNLGQWADLLASFEKDDAYHLLVGEDEGKIVSSVTLIIIRNLTHNLRPYAVIENVVTHQEYRGRHYASILMEYAEKTARQAGCYKIMLMTGSKLESTLQFYENCGYSRTEKTAFLKWLPA